jgi:hypothetical protein
LRDYLVRNDGNYPINHKGEGFKIKLKSIKMKNLIINLVLASILLCNTTLSAQSQSTITTATTFVAKTNIVVPSSMEAEVRNVAGSRATVEAHISANCSSAVLQALVKSGYFSILTKTTDVNTLDMSMPNIAKHLFINGQDLIIEIKLVILVPAEVFLASK